MALSTSDFAGDGNPSSNLATERHQRTRGAPGQSPLSSGKSKAIRKPEIQLCEQGAFSSVIQATHPP